MTKPLPRMHGRRRPAKSDGARPALRGAAGLGERRAGRRARLAILLIVVGLLNPAFALLSTAWADQPVPPVLMAPGNGTVRALVIGIDHYRSVSPLRGAVADARDIEASLRRMGAEDVTLLTDDAANRPRVLTALEDLVARSRSGDLVFITLAGHGSKEDERVKGSSPDHSDEVFLLVGFNAASGPGGTEKILNHEFHHYIRQLEDRGAQVIFVADTCYGGGLARDIAAGMAAEVSFRQVPRYRLVADDLKPVSTTAEAFLTELDFRQTTFLAAVDNQTKAPEVTINGVYRGALSYAVARAVEGAADEKHDGRITSRELFAYARKVVYQLSDERQNIVAQGSPQRDLDREVVLKLGTRGVAQAVAVPPVALPTGTPAAPMRSIRVSTTTYRTGALADLRPLLTPFTIVPPNAPSDLIWDPVAREALAGGDKVALDVGLAELPGVIDRTAAVRDLKDLVVGSPQEIHVLPDASLHRRGTNVEVMVPDVAGRSLVLVDITGSGTVQLLYPDGAAAPLLTSADYRIPFRVRDPFGADEVLAVTSHTPMEALVDALHGLDNRRSAGRLIDVLTRFRPPDARVGLVGLFTVP